jgi:hypothetical protein
MLPVTPDWFSLLCSREPVSTVRPSGTGASGSNAGWVGRSYTLGFEPVLVVGRPCDLPGCAASANP